LNNAVVKYTKAAKDIRERVMTWRLQKMRDDKEIAKYGHRGIPIYSPQVVDDFCDWRSDKGRSTKEIGIHFIERAEQIRRAHGKNLDAILSPIAHWASSTERASPALKETATGSLRATMIQPPTSQTFSTIYSARNPTTRRPRRRRSLRSTSILRSLLSYTIGSPNCLRRRLWKKKCTSCHQWNQARLREQAQTYVQAPRNVLRVPHPFGGTLKLALMRWAISGCQ
jgi:hypothetical protein